VRQVRRDVRTLDDFFAKSQGDRLQFVDGVESFDRLVFPRLDNKLGNAIAHTSYTQDLAQQRITYYPSGVTGKGAAKRISMIDAVQSCWSVFLCIVDIMELHYQTEKLTTSPSREIRPWTRAFSGAESFTA
jgi:hypothetical protein